MTSSSISVVHYFDPNRHSVPCGVAGFAERSTKHARQVTCPACMAALHDDSPSAAQASAHEDASHAW